MLTTIDLPVVSRMTRASAREPFLGMMLTVNVRSVVQVASELDVPRQRRDDAYRAISFEPLDAALLDALVRLVTLLDESTLAPRLGALIQQEVIIRLLTGPHGLQLLHLVTSGSASQQIAKSVAWLKQNFVETFRIDDVAYRTHMTPSQFSLEYSRLFGAPPLCDVSRMGLAQRAVEPRRTPAGQRRRVWVSLSDRAASSAADRLTVDR
jgi:hypothetical protein